MARSFSELRLILHPGDEILVIRADGQRSRGLVRTITDSSLDVNVTTFTEAAVSEVKRLDSTLDGRLIGAGVGVAAGFATCRSMCLAYLYAVPVLFGFGGWQLGGWFDRVTNQIVYRASTTNKGTVTITLSPLLTGKWAGASMSLRF